MCGTSESLVNIVSGTNNILESIDLSNALRFFCLCYLIKHKSIMNNSSITRFHESFMDKPMPDENLKLLSWLGYPPDVECIPTMRDWCMFVHKVTFHKGNATKDLEANLLPTYTALTRHILRATYVLKLVFSVTSSNCPVLKSHCSYGWVEIGPEKVVEIDWDDGCVVETFLPPWLHVVSRKGVKQLDASVDQIGKNVLLNANV